MNGDREPTCLVKKEDSNETNKFYTKTFVKNNPKIAFSVFEYLNKNELSNSNLNHYYLSEIARKMLHAKNRN